MRKHSVREIIHTPEMAQTDWTLPPHSSNPESLWPALHDAVLEGFSEDRLTREIRLTFTLGFPDPAETAPECVILVLHGVTHTLLVVSRMWPGPIPKNEAEYEAYRGKGRAETVGIETLAACLSEKEYDVDVSHSELHRSPAGLGLKIDGYSADDRLGDWWDLRIGAESLDVLHEDGSPWDSTPLWDSGKRAGISGRQKPNPENGIRLSRTVFMRKP